MEVSAWRALTGLASIFLLLIFNAAHLSRRRQFIVSIVASLVLHASYVLLFEQTPILLLALVASFQNVFVLIGLFWIWRFLYSKAKWLSYTLAGIIFLGAWIGHGLHLFTIGITALLVISEEVQITPPFFPKIPEADFTEGEYSLAGRKAFLVMNLFILLFFSIATGIAEYMGASRWISILLQIPVWISGIFIFTGIYAIMSGRET